MMFKHYFKKDDSIQKVFAELCPLNNFDIYSRDLVITTPTLIARIK
jgi:hypothetical protein